MKKLFLVLALITNAFGQTQEHSQDITSNKVGSNKLALIKRVFGFKTPTNLIEATRSFDLVKSKNFAHTLKDLNEKQQKEVIDNLDFIEKILKSNLTISEGKNWRDVISPKNWLSSSVRPSVGITALLFSNFMLNTNTGILEYYINFNKFKKTMGKLYRKFYSHSQMDDKAARNFMISFAFIDYLLIYNFTPYFFNNLKLGINISYNLAQLAEIKKIIECQQVVK